MIETMTYFFVELGITLLNIILLILSLVFYGKDTKTELDNQLDEIDNKINKHANEIGTAWANANSNCNFNKTLQWNYIYYVVLLFAAIFALATNEHNSKIPAVQILLIVGANMVFHVGMYLTIQIQVQIRRERLSVISIQYLIAYRIEDNAEIIKELNKRKNEAIFLFSHPYINFTLIMTTLIGYSICLYIIIKNTLSI